MRRFRSVVADYPIERDHSYGLSDASIRSCLHDYTIRSWWQYHPFLEHLIASRSATLSLFCVTVLLPFWQCIASDGLRATLLHESFVKPQSYLRITYVKVFPMVEYFSRFHGQWLSCGIHPTTGLTRRRVWYCRCRRIATRHRRLADTCNTMRRVDRKCETSRSTLWAQSGTLR